MIVTQRVTRTPLLAGSDPFERFPEAGETSIGPPAPGSVGRGDRQHASVLESIATLINALTSTELSQPSAAFLIGNMAERVQLTLANFAESLPLLSFRPPPKVLVDPAPQRTSARGSAVRALRAAADLSHWLGMTEEQIADLAGFSRRNYSNWRGGQGSYLKTVRELFEIHALVGRLVRELGDDGATAWMALPSPTGRSRRQLLTTSAGRARLLSEAQPLLFVKAERDVPIADFEYEDLGAVSTGQHQAARNNFGDAAKAEA